MQRVILARTFGCVRVVWNRTLAERHRLYHAEGENQCYAASDAALTATCALQQPKHRPGCPAGGLIRHC